MVNTNLTTTEYKIDILKNIANNISSFNDYYYLYIGDFVTHANSTVQNIYNNTRDTFYDVYKNMILAKLISSADVAYGTRYVPWEDNKLFTMYDNNELNLETLDFYCTTIEGSSYHTWKCLNNNLESNSTIQPLFSDIINLSDTYQTSDGYEWKYMYSVDTSVVDTFKVENSYFPVVVNSNVTANAINGSIEIIKIEDQGRLYNNYINGSLRTTDIFIGGNKTLFNISNNSSSIVNGFYTNCLLYVTSGTLNGQYKTIVDYQSNSSGNIFEIDTEFSTSPQNGDTYEIRPRVNIYGDTTQTINCVARALVNALNSNSIHRIEVLEKGKDYKYVSANIVANSVVNIINPCSVRPILSPCGGHGYDSLNELYATNLIVSATLSNTENSTIPSVNKFQQIGILKNPLFSNVYIQFLILVNSFTVGEKISNIDVTKLSTNCTTLINNTVITNINGSFTTQLTANQHVYITLPDTSLNQLSQIESIANNTSMNLTSNVLFTSNTVDLYSANITATAICTGISISNTIITTNVSNRFIQASLCIGEQSGALGIIDNVKRNDVVKNYNTFIQMYKYNVTIVNGVFINGEVIKQGNNYAYLHSISGDLTYMYINNFNEGPFIADQIVGNTSGAIATISSIYSPEVTFGSGKILYVENISPVTRQVDQNENIQLVFNTTTL